MPTRSTGDEAIFLGLVRVFRPGDAMTTVHGWVAFESWAGRVLIHAQLVDETPERYRVRWLESKLNRRKGVEGLVPKGSCRWLLPGECIGPTCREVSP